ncbi:glycosyltransferase [Butyrivibrio sp. VCD2006]|uniref:glycosyltransferase n=1 Tax=Butyrivibrio sp. VCD2006 TaxID=1280664 RepID=UPI00040BF396|nr:glycosyltransferase [Butyrivibrio sp. VCD2006]
MGIQNALRLFDSEEYDMAMKEFITSFEDSESEEVKAMISDIIKENFVCPNLDEFKAGYNDNVKYMEHKGYLHGLTAPIFEKLVLRMIPVSDEKYYVWDDRTNEFCGKGAVDLDELRDLTHKRFFDSVLMDGYSDGREVFAELCENDYMHRYLVLDNEMSVLEFFSFITIPQIIEKYVGEIHVFVSKDELKAYLMETGNYLPRTVYCKNGYDYDDMLKEVHDARLKLEKKNKPYLSICIPTKDRGKEALENVKVLQRLPYDEEIEIVISNNGSTGEMEFYEQIQNEAEHDSRVSYGEFPASEFSYSIGQVLYISKGEFFVLLSDEDRLKTEEIGNALQFIYENEKKGAILFRLEDRNGEILYDDYNTTNDVFDSILSAFSVNYVTGICYSAAAIMDNDMAFKIWDKYSFKNCYFTSYAHNVLFAYAVRNRHMAGGGPVLFKKEKETKSARYEDNKHNLTYLQLDTRLDHLDAQIDIVFDLQLSVDQTIGMIVELQERVYKLMYGAYYLHREDMNEISSWKDCCGKIYRHNVKMWDKSKLRKICQGDMHNRITEVLKKYYNIHLHDFD